MNTPLAHPMSNRFKQNNDESYFIISNQLRANLRTVYDLYKPNHHFMNWTPENIEIMASQLEEMAKLDPFLMSLEEYYVLVGINHQGWNKLAQENPRITQAINNAKEAIGARRENATWMNDFPVSVMLKTAGQYLNRYQQAEQDSENIKAKAKVAADAELMKRTFTFKTKMFDKDGNEIIKMTTVGPEEKETNDPQT